MPNSVTLLEQGSSAHAPLHDIIKKLQDGDVRLWILCMVRSRSEDEKYSRRLEDQFLFVDNAPVAHEAREGPD